MIVPMKKVTLFVSTQDKDNALKELRKLGIVHIHQTHIPASDDLLVLENEIGKVDKCIGIMGKEKVEITTKPADSSKAKAIIDKVISLTDRRLKLAGEYNIEKEKRNWFLPWGDVSRSEIEELKKKGIYIRLYAVDKSFIKRIPPEKMIYIVAEDKSRHYLALVTEDENEKLDVKEDFPPAEDLMSIEDRIAALEKELLFINDEISDISKSQPLVANYHTQLQKRYEFAKVRSGMENIEVFSYLEGFCPEDTVDELKKLADGESWGYIFEEPDDPTIVPTLVKNSKLVRIIDPVFKFMGTLPGYNETDISFFFLIFFSLFFALLIGDAGYGMLMLLAMLYFRRKNKTAPGEFFYLMYVLSGATIIWGAITGTWFGFERIAQLPVFRSLIIDEIYIFSKSPEKVQDFMMYFSFLIGAIHLTIAHSLNALKKRKTLAALGQIGWVLDIWAVFFIAGTVILNRPFPSIALYSLAIGATLILLFANYEKGRFVKGMIQTVSSLPLDIISSFSDVVSYLRLFAVGLACSIVETSFNEMAIGDGISSVFTGLITTLILLLGHSLNIMLGFLSVIVHGIRLNMLEFSGHLGMQWSGKKYEPFRE